MAAVTYTCVGSGTCVPSQTRGPACHLLEVDGRSILLDLGSGSLRSLARMGVRWEEVAAVGLTHRHQDHVADLLPLLFALRNTPGLERAQPLELFGYPGLASDVERLAGLYGRWVRAPGFELRVRELEPGAPFFLQGELAGVRVTGIGVRHSPEAVGFRVEVDPVEGGPPLVFAYSGDSGPTQALVELASGATLFVSECAFPDGQEAENHLTPAGLLPLCEEAGARRTVMTHFYPVWDETGVDRLLAEALARFGRTVPIVAAHDGLRIEVHGGSTC